MARTFSSIVTEALGNDFDSTTYSTQAGIWVNDCLRLLARNAHIPLSDATNSPTIVAGTASYSLPSDFIRAVEVWNTSTHEPLEQVDQSWIDQQAAASGTPEAFALYQGNIVFYPTPSAATSIQLRYIKTSSDLSGVNPLSGVIPDEYGDVIVDYLRWHLFRMEDDVQLAAFWEAQFNEAFAALKADLQKRGNATRQIPGMWRSEKRPRFVRPT